MLCVCYFVLIGSEVEVYSEFSIGRSKVNDSYRFCTITTSEMSNFYEIEFYFPAGCL